MIKKLLIAAVIALFSINTATAEFKHFAANNTDLNLSLKLLRQNFAESPENFVLSPLSVYEASALLANGAAGQSLQELQTNILGSEDMPKVNNILDTYRRNITKTVEINDSVWGNNINPEYIKTVTEKLHAEVMPLPENTSVINQWVSRKTFGRIDNVMAEEKLENPLKIYLVNTIWFRDNWENRFDKHNTKKEDFYSLGTTMPDKVNMMHDIRNTDYFENEVMQAIRIPYESGDVIQIFLPLKEVDFAEFIKNLKAEDLQPNYENTEVIISLPRFEIDYKVKDMQAMFKQFGVNKVFDWNLDLIGFNMSDEKNIKRKVEKIIHQVKIKLDENGTEAAAVTVMDVDENGVGADAPVKRAEPPKFIVDHPFIFMINDGLFIGVYTKGSETEAGFNPNDCYGIDKNDYDCLLQKAEENHFSTMASCLRQNKSEDDARFLSCIKLGYIKGVTEEDFVYDSAGYVVGYTETGYYDIEDYDMFRFAVFNKDETECSGEPCITDHNGLIRKNKRKYIKMSDGRIKGEIIDGKMNVCAHFNVDGKIILDDDVNCHPVESNLLKCYNTENHYDYDCLLRQAEEQQETVYKSCLTANRAWYEEWRKTVNPKTPVKLGAGLAQCRFVRKFYHYGEEFPAGTLIYNPNGYVIGYTAHATKGFKLFGITLYRKYYFETLDGYDHLYPTTRKYFTVLFGKILGKKIREAEDRLIFEESIFPPFSANNDDK